MNYAVVKISGKQYPVELGTKLTVDSLEAKEGETINLDQVLLFVDGSKVEVGTPSLSGKSISAKVLEHKKGAKIRVAKFKAKSRYRRVQGHRQHQTVLEIVSLNGKKSPTRKTTTSKTKKPPVSRSKKSK